MKWSEVDYVLARHKARIIHESLQGQLTLEQSLIVDTHQGIDFQLDRSDEAECIFQHSIHPDRLNPNDFSDDIKRTDSSTSVDGSVHHPLSTQHWRNSRLVNDTTVVATSKEEDVTSCVNESSQRNVRK
jgi:hypothetical protein